METSNRNGSNTNASFAKSRHHSTSINKPIEIRPTLSYHKSQCILNCIYDTVKLSNHDDQTSPQGSTSNCWVNSFLICLFSANFHVSTSNSGPKSRPCPRSFSARKILLDLSLAPSEAQYLFLGSGSFSAKSLDRILRYLHFCEIIFGKCA